MKTLNISKELHLPINAVTQTFAIMAKRGVGKTHTASVMAEEMLKRGQPVVIYDPTGAWWGLKSSADGKQPGFPVVIFGGEHADVPLEETAGEMIATVIVERRLPAILDCSLLRKGARIRFMTSFCEALYHKNREPIHMFVDEAQTVAPQNLKAMPEIARLVGALEDIILQGRRRGLGVTVISPRPAILNTSIRSACEVLIAMQIVGPHDRKAIQEWIDVHGDDTDKAKEMMTSLSSLKRGEAWVWSPAWLELFVRTKFRRRETFDSSATPEVGHRMIKPSRMADVDLKKLGDEIAATVERVKADDPKALRAEIAKLKRDLAAKPETKIVKEGPVKIKTIEKPVIGKKAVAAIEKAAKEIRRATAKIQSVYADIEPLLRHSFDSTVSLEKTIERVTNTPSGSHPPSIVAGKPAPGPMAGSGLATNSVGREGGNGAVLPGPQQRIIDAIAWFESIGITAPETTAVAFLAGYKAGGGAFNNPRGSLRSAGLVEYRGSCMALTGSGLARANHPGLPLTNDELQRRVLNRLPGPERKLLETVIARYPESITDQELADAAGYAIGGGAFNNPKGRLRTLGIVTYPAPKTVRAADLLFPLGG